MRITTYKKGGNSLNPLIKLSIFLIILSLFVIPVNAITYTNLVADPIGLGYYSPTTMLEIESTDGLINIFNPDGSGSLETKIYDLPAIDDAALGGDGLIYFVLRDGRVFQNTNSNYKSFANDYNTSFVLLGTLTDPSSRAPKRSLIIDGNNNIYVSSANYEIYKYTYPSMSQSLYKTITALYGSDRMTIQSLALHPDGLLVGLSVYNLQGKEQITLIDKNDLSLTSLYVGDSELSDRYIKGLSSTSTGDIYFNINNALYKLDRTDSYTKSTISVLSSSPDDMIILSDGVIYLSSVSENIISTYSTTDLTGGYSEVVGEIEGSYINWDSSYVLGDTGSYTWGWDADDKSILRSEKVKIYKDNDLIDTITVSDTGTRYLDLNVIGNYKIELVTTFPFTQDQIYASDYLDVTEAADSWINVPQADYTGNSFEFEYMYGRTPLGGFLKTSKRIPSSTGDYTYIDYDYRVLPVDIVGGVTYTHNITMYESGEYLVGIYDIDLLSDSGSTLQASDIIRIFYQDAMPTLDILESKIDTSNVSDVGMGDIVTGNYQVDNLNYSNGSVRLEVYNYENDIISFSIPKQKQKGNYEIPISNLEYIEQVIDGVAKIYKVDSIFYTGNNQVRISRYDNTGVYNQTLAFTNITIDYVNSAGYSLTVSKKNLLIDEDFTIYVKCPTTASILVYDNTGFVIDTIELAGNTNIPYSFKDDGKYSIQLYDPAVKLQGIELLTVINRIAEPTAAEDTSETLQSNTNKLLNSPYLIALFIMIVFLAIGATNGIEGIMVTGVIGAGICVFLELLPAWIIFLIVLVLIVVISKSTFSNGGGG